MNADSETLAVYAARMADYDDLGMPRGALDDLHRFLGGLQAGGRVLDLGCGPGHAAAEMARCGFRVDAWDGTPEMVARAASHPGVTARLARFDDLAAEEAYDGIWASFSLLHAPRADLPGLLRRIRRALVPGGWLYLGMKTGTGERRDALGRFYAYHLASELIGQLRRAGLRPLLLGRGRSVGMAGLPEPFVTLLARRPCRSPEKNPQPCPI